jgi:hypothetical protein
MREQVRYIVEEIGHIRSNVQQIGLLDKTIAELMIHSQNAQVDLSKIWSRVDENRGSGQLLDAKIDREIKIVDTKIEKMMSSWRAGVAVATILLTLFQSIIGGSIYWIFSHVSEGEVVNRLQQQSIESLQESSQFTKQRD